MRGVNAVTLMGNTGGNPEVKYTTEGSAVTTFNIAITEKFKNKSSGELKERTDWFKVVCFPSNSTATYCRSRKVKSGPGSVWMSWTTKRNSQ